MSQIHSLRFLLWRWRGEVTTAEAKLLRKLEAEFAANNERLKRRQRICASKK